jgi:hypothetical protein
VLASDVITFPAAFPAAPIAAPIGLKNTDSVGVLIDQLAFSVAFTDGTGSAQDIGVSLRYRGEPLTNGWVSVSAICPVRTEEFDQEGFRVVRLERPLFLAPGEGIDVSGAMLFGHTVPRIFQVVAQGRFADPPETRWLPYFSTFAGAVQDRTSGALFSSVSTPQDLGNPFKGPLVLERLVGRVLTSTSATGPFGAGIPTVASSPFNVRLSDDQSRWWIPTPTPIHTVVNVLTRSWRLNYTLPPSGFLRVEIEGTATWPASGVRYAIPIVGMVGYRRIG